jgi:hypothetical protein
MKGGSEVSGPLFFWGRGEENQRRDAENYKKPDPVHRQMERSNKAHSQEWLCHLVDVGGEEDVPEEGS